MKKWVLIGVSIAGMGIFCYYTFYETSAVPEELTNPARMEDSPSRQALNAEKRKNERKFAYDRKISSIDNFLKNEVEEDPFDTTEIADSDTVVVVKDKVNTEEIPIEYRTIIKVIEKPVPIVERESERRKGFASGDVVYEKQVADGYEPVSIAVVVHEDVMVTSGSLVKLRTLNPEGGAALPVNSFLVGKARISGDRLYISVPEFTIREMEEPVDLEAFDTNGIQGLLITGGNEITGRAMEDVVGEVQRNVDVPLLRDLPFTSARRKIREKEIPLRSGTKLYLKAL